MTEEASRILFVSGLVGRDEAGSPISGTVNQTTRIFDRLAQVLESRRLGFESVVRVRAYLTDISDWPHVSTLLEGRFAASVPPCTVLGVSALVQPWMRVEMDFEARLSTS